MKILLVGSGGREHALAWRLAQSRGCDALYGAPGNAGMEECAECVDIAADDIDALVKFAQDNKIGLAVIGPEAPLVAGLADRLRAVNIPAFGPSAAAARLEGSKGFMKDLCAKYGIPTAAYGRFTDAAQAEKFIRETGAPIVIKVDGLAAGKGVIIAQTIGEAVDAACGMLSGASFGAAGASVVIEEFLDGEELSYFAIADGKTVLPLASAQDHKRAFDGDKGPNTGGMGAYSPAHLLTPAMDREIMEKIIHPAVGGMEKEGCPFTGILFAGIMVVKGKPWLLEFNTRFGDPECQTLMMRLNTNLVDLLYNAATGNLACMADKLSWRSEAALCVVMAANGYPGAYEKNTVIGGLMEADSMPHAKIFHAGTKRGANGDILANGGRVLGVTALGDTIESAQKAAYDAVDRIDWPGGFCRRDIGGRAVAASGREGRRSGKISTFR